MLKRTQNAKVNRFLRDRRGVAAIEFAAVALPFFTLIFATCDLAVATVAQVNLDVATSNGQRMIRTGRAQLAGMTRSQLKDRICNDMKRLMSANCANLFISVDTFESFGDVDEANPIQEGEVSDSGMNFDLGGPEDVVMVRTYYKHKLATPGLSHALQQLPGGYRLLASGFVFRNEPYPVPAGG